MKKKIALAIPLSWPYAPAQFMISLFVAIMRAKDKYDLGLIVESQGFLDTMRDNGTKRFLDSGAGYIIWFDADQVYPPDTILRLGDYLDCGLKIVAGLTPDKTGRPLAFRFDSDGKMIRDDSIRPGMGLVEVAGYGMGGVAIAREVFEAFGPPWFERRDSDVHKHCLNEDIAFYLRAKKAGFEMYIDTDLTFEHIVSFPLSFNTPKIFQGQVTR